MSRIDLDQVQASIDQCNVLNPQAAYALVAELRAARKAREQLIHFHGNFHGETWNVRPVIARILHEWDGAIGEAVG